MYKKLPEKDSKNTYKTVDKNKKKKKRRPPSEGEKVTSKEQTTRSTKKKKSSSTGNRKKREGLEKKKVQTTKKNTKRKNDKKQTISKKNKKSLIIQRIFDVFFIFVIIFMLAGAAIFVVSDQTDKSFYGYRFYEVLTNSMRKTEKGQKGNFVAGDMIIVKLDDPNEIEVGDIITFVPNKKSPDTYLTHRVIEKEPANPQLKKESDGSAKTEGQYPTFITQGDANNAPDPPVSGEMVIGVVKFAIPKAGTIITFVKGNLLAVFVFVTAFFLLIYVIKGYFMPEEEPVKENKQKPRKKKKKPQRNLT